MEVICYLFQETDPSGICSCSHVAEGGRLQKPWRWVVLGALLYLSCTKDERSSPPASKVPAAPSHPVVLRPMPRRLPMTSKNPAALALFHKGLVLVDHNRQTEAVDQFRLAIAQDPAFALAHAFLGYLTPGAGGSAELSKAQALAGDLPEAEREFIDLYAAIRRADTAKVDSLLQSLLTLLPDEWRVTFEVGQRAYDRGDWERAVLAYTRSLDGAQNCLAYNNLAYALAMQDRFDLAIASVKKCRDLAPTEPNPYDTLGEMQLAAGHLDEAGASFERAVELNPKFWSAFHGAALVHFLKDETADGFKALEGARAATERASDRAEADVATAWAQLAMGRPEAALKTLEVLERESRAAHAEGFYGLAFAALTRSQLLLELGKPQEAVKQANLALERIDASAETLANSITGSIRRRALVRRALAENRLERWEAAEKTLSELEGLEQSSGGRGEVRGALHLVKGAKFLARRQFEAARTEFGRCDVSGLSPWTYDYVIKPEDLYCTWQNVLVAERLGDTRAADATRKRLLAKPSRDPLFLYVARKLKPEKLAP